jgi:hypothetical protein
MRATSLIVLSALLSVPAAGVAPARGAGAGREITGTVEKADSESGRLVVEGQTLFMPPNPEAPSLKAGDRVTLGYEERDGRKVVTSFRQTPK